MGDAGGRRERVALAAVAGAHGVKGELRLKLFTDDVQKLKTFDTIYVGGTERKLVEARQSGKNAVARFGGISNRDGAEALRGALVEVERADLPALEEDEYYHADLLGLPCVDGEGAELGHVVAVENFGAGDLLEIELVGGNRSLIPFRDGIADLDGGRIIIDPEFLA